MPLGGFAPLPLRLGGTAINGFTAAQHARLCADMVACVKTAAFATIGLTTNSAVVSSYHSQSLIGIGNAPTVTPGGGLATVTWPTGYRDPFGIYHAIRITNAEVSIATISAPSLVEYTIDAPNIVTVRAYAMNGFPLDDYPVFLVVY